MSMTKAERAEMETLRTQLAETKALRFLGVLEPERMPLPEKGYVNGWLYYAHQEGRIGLAWSEHGTHGHGAHRSDDGQWKNRPMGSQNGAKLYRTKRDALIGLRLAKERECAKLLAKIDRAIEDETP